MKKPRVDSNPRLRRHAGWPPSSFALTLVLIIASLYWAQTFIIPIALSILLTFFLSPIAGALERLGLGRLPSVGVVVLLVFSLLAVMGWVLTLQLTSVANELPTYRNNIKQKIADIRIAGRGGALEKVHEAAEDVKKELANNGPARDQPKPREVVVQAEESSTFWPLPLATAPLFERLAGAGLVVVLVIFMLIQRERLRDRLIRLVGYGSLTVTTRALEEAGQRISRYLLMQSIINASFGISVSIALFLIGLPYALLWGFLAAVLRFIPYVGTWVAALMPTALSIAVFKSWEWTILVIGIIVVLELINNMILEPVLYGESAGVSQVGLLVAVAFWTWLWGPIGLVLATPLTVCVVVISKYVPQMNFIGVLMSDEPVLRSDINYYQRLLAMDQAEAEEIVEKHLHSHPVEQVYDDVMLPALSYARRDGALGRLTETEEQFVFQATREILEDLEELKPKPGSIASDPSAERTGAKASMPSSKLLIMGCPAQDEADALALAMFRDLLDARYYEMELVADATLTSEVIARIAEKHPALICISSLPPDGLGQTRSLCKRLRIRYPEIKILVGRWGDGAEDSIGQLLSAGADKVGTTMIESRDQVKQLSQIISR